MEEIRIENINDFAGFSKMCSILGGRSEKLRDWTFKCSFEEKKPINIMIDNQEIEIWAGKWWKPSTGKIIAPIPKFFHISVEYPKDVAIDKVDILDSVEIMSAKINSIEMYAREKNKRLILRIYMYG